MKEANKQRLKTETLVLGAVLTALVIVLQCMGQFIRFGVFSISLVLLPIVIGAATCGTKISTWLGFVFGVVVLCTDAAVFWAIDVFGTIVTVITKGIACGFAAGIVYDLLKDKNQYVAIGAAAIVCPIVNTGIFLLGCLLFFFEAIEGWGLSFGASSTFEYMILGLVGGNFLFEMMTNIVLSPIIVRVLNSIKK